MCYDPAATCTEPDAMATKDADGGDGYWRMHESLVASPKRG